MVQWLRFSASTAGGTSSIPGRGTKIPHAAQCSQKKKKTGGTGIGIHQKFSPRGGFAPSGDTGQCLETFLVVKTDGGGRWGCVPGIW